MLFIIGTEWKQLKVDRRIQTPAVTIRIINSESINSSVWLICSRKPQVTHSQRLNTNTEENKGVVRGRKKNPERLQNDNDNDNDNEQLKYDLTVLFSSIFIFNLWEWVTFDVNQRYFSEWIHE